MDTNKATSDVILEKGMYVYLIFSLLLVIVFYVKNY